MRGQQEAVRRDRRPEPDAKQNGQYRILKGYETPNLEQELLCVFEQLQSDYEKAQKGVGERLRELANGRRGNQPEQPGVERAIVEATALSEAERQQDRTVERGRCCAWLSRSRGWNASVKRRTPEDGGGRGAGLRQRGHDFGI